MHVQLNSAAIHVALEEAYGLPQPNEMGDEELFGPYKLPEGEFFWIWDGGLQVWRIEPAQTPSKFGFIPIYDPTTSDPKIEPLIENLAFFAIPEWPNKPGSHVDKIYFSYGGYLFKWLRIDAVKRWVLVPIGCLSEQYSN